MANPDILNEYIPQNRSADDYTETSAMNSAENRTTTAVGVCYGARTQLKQILGNHPVYNTAESLFEEIETIIRTGNTS